MFNVSRRIVCVMQLKTYGDSGAARQKDEWAIKGVFVFIIKFQVMYGNNLLDYFSCSREKCHNTKAAHMLDKKTVNFYAY